MSRATQNAQDYWDERSVLFSNYYEAPSLFDRVFRKGIYTRVAVAVDVCKGLERPTVLDIGSGPGVNSMSLLKNTTARHLTGIDFAPTMISHSEELAKREGLEDKCTFIEADFMTHDFRDGEFDFTCALGVLDYVEGANEFVEKMARVTAKKFVISWPENGLRMMLRRKRYDCPVYHYSEDDIRRFFGNAGISQLELVKYDGGWASIATCD